jgi:hypothetical protein
MPNCSLLPSLFFLELGGLMGVAISKLKSSVSTVWLTSFLRSFRLPGVVLVTVFLGVTPEALAAEGVEGNCMNGIPGGGIPGVPGGGIPGEYPYIGMGKGYCI